MKKYLPYIAWIAVFQLIGTLIGSFTRADMVWYESLIKPPLTPPNFVFGIVWPILYVMLAVAGCRLWQQRARPGRAAINSLFAIFMAMNWAWSFLFFTGHRLLVSFFEIVIMDVVLFVLVALCWKQDKMTVKIIFPTLLWIFFATYLNYECWALNN